MVSQSHCEKRDNFPGLQPWEVKAPHGQPVYEAPGMPLWHWPWDHREIPPSRGIQGKNWEHCWGTRVPPDIKVFLEGQGSVLPGQDESQGKWWLLDFDPSCTPMSLCLLLCRLRCQSLQPSAQQGKKLFIKHSYVGPISLGWGRGNRQSREQLQVGFFCVCVVGLQFERRAHAC
jgi:hypothetical protein